MKKFRIFAVLVLVFAFVYGSVQFCMAESIINVEGQGDNIRLVFNLNGKRYELSLNPYTGDVKDDTAAVNNSSQNNASAISQNTAQGEITIDQAKNIALDAAGANASQVTFIKEKRDFDDGIEVYEIEFIYNNREYEYEIAVKGGRILKSDIDYERFANGVNTANGQYNISVTEAEDIALKDANVARSAVDFINAYPGRDDGFYIYEVEFYTGNVKYEYEINAADGTILQSDMDNERYYGSTQNNGSNQTGTAADQISAQEAENIALKDAGVQRADARYVRSHIDRDDGRTVYEVEFAVGYTEYDYEIAVESGNIISKDVDRD